MPRRKGSHYAASRAVKMPQLNFDAVMMLNKPPHRRRRAAALQVFKAKYPQPGKPWQEERVAMNTAAGGFLLLLSHV